MIDRRKFLRASLWVAAAPIIVRASSLMHIRALPPVIELNTDALLLSLQTTRWAIEYAILNAGAGYAVGESITFA